MGFRSKIICAGFIILSSIFAIGCFGANAVQAQEAEPGHPVSEFERVDRLETQIAALYAQTREIDADLSEQDADKENRILRAMVALYTEIIDQSPQKASAQMVDNYIGRGAVYFDLGEYEQALNDDNTALNISPDYVLAMNNRAIDYEALGFPDKALSDFEQFLKIGNDDPHMPPILREMVQNKANELRPKVAMIHLVQASITQIEFFFRRFSGWPWLKLEMK
ncbi:MAG: tetratricopeptide repeat protein [Chloroflexi bacterium]|nr:tetratricopeptide repeat protein [Chloroflexota bacterium]